MVGSIISSQVQQQEWVQRPSPVANAGGGPVNPWKTGNITQQMLILEQDPQLAAVLKQEAQK